MKHIIRIFFKITGWLSAIIYFKYKVYYINKKEQSRRIKNKAIIMVNHKSVLDFVLIMTLFGLRYIRCVVGETLYDSNRVLRFILKNLGAIKVNRTILDLEFMKKAINVLDNNGVIEIYPEGRLPKKGEEMLPFRPSICHLALQSNAPIIPVYHTGNYGLFKREKIVIGEKIYLSHYCQTINPSKEEIAQLLELLQNKMLELKNFYERKMYDKKKKSIKHNKS